MRKHIPKLRQVSQVLISIPCDNIEKSFHDVRPEILKWAQRRAGHKLPRDAWEGNSFELDKDGAQPVEAIHLEEQGYYAFRLVYGDKKIPQRYWQTEATVAKYENEILLGMRLFCTTMGESAPFVHSVPGLVRQIVENYDAHIDGRRIGDTPWVVNEKEEVNKLFSLLISPNRKHDVCVISTKDESEDISSTLIEADKFFVQTIGAVHTVVLTSSASYEFTNRVGKQLSAYRQAVRTYRPGFNPDESENYVHPLALAEKISSWDGGPAAFKDFLITQCLGRTVAEARIRREEKIPPYAQVKEAARELRRKQTRQTIKSKQEELDLVYEEIEEMKEQMAKNHKEYDQILLEAEEEKEQVAAELNEANDRIESLKSRIELLENTQSDIEVPIPKNFDELDDWSQKHLAGRVLVHSRAIRTAQNAEKECGPDNIRLVYESLLILRDHYVPMRTKKGLKRKKAYQQKLQTEGLEETPTFRGPRAGEQGDTYFLKFAGRRRKLEHHLKKGVGRDPRECFRLYFFWDSTTQQVVVGSFPKHLKNRAT